MLSDIDSNHATAAPPARPSAASFDALYADRYDRMVRLAYLMVGDNAVAEELVQDAFARVHQRWSKVDNPGGYLHVTVLNAARNELRRRSRRQRQRPTAQPTEAHVDEASVELLDALRVLSARQRAAVVLRFYEGRSEAEIADLLHVRPGTVKSLLHRALDRLREVIEL